MKLIRYHSPYNRHLTAVDRLFGIGAPVLGHAEGLFEGVFGARSGIWQPAVDLFEDEDNYYARLELPGVRKDCIDLKLEDGELTIRDLESQASGVDARSVHFYRTVTLPEGVSVEDVSALYEDGVLSVTLPKQAARKARQVTIQ